MRKIEAVKIGTIKEKRKSQRVTENIEPFSNQHRFYSINMRIVSSEISFIYCANCKSRFQDCIFIFS